MKRIIIALFAITLLSTSAVYAASINGNYKGYPIVNVVLNGKKVASDVPAIVLDSRTLLPVRALAETLNSIVHWDQKTMTASIIKPSVNMIFASNLTEENDGTLTLSDASSHFNTTGTDMWENLYVDVGPMDNKTYEYRIAVYDPTSKIIGTSAVYSEVFDEEGLILFIPVENMTYSNAGNYKFCFQLKVDGKFITIGETVAVIK